MYQPDSIDSRSDDKGPEPEALSLVEIGEWVYALVGLERTGGLMVFDVTHPTSAVFQQWLYDAAHIGHRGMTAGSDLRWKSAVAPTAFQGVCTGRARSAA